MTASAQIGGSGWVPMTVKFHVQSPTNVPQNQRYFVTNSPLATYHCLTYSNDGAFSVGNTTKPRTEQRFDPDYTNGEIQYQANLMAPGDENSYCVFQIHTGDSQSGTYGSTTFMAFWFTNYGGSIHDYSGTTLATNLGNKWFQLNVDHNLVTGTIKVWVNQKLVWTQQDNGAGDFYMKDGVYEQDHNPTYRMDTYITNILMWTSSGGAIVPLTWTGRTNGVNTSSWDQGTTTDWVNSTNGDIAFYQDGCPVTFNDSPGSGTVNLQSAVSPNGVTVSSVLKSYFFTGSGGIGGSGGLTKAGPSTLILGTANSFSGNVTINGGTLIVSNTSALGDTTGVTIVNSGGTLDINGTSLGGEPVTVSGGGAIGQGAILNNGAQATTALRNLTLASNTTFGGTGRWDIRNSGGTASLNTSPSGSAFNITKVGTNQVSLVGVDPIDPQLGDIDVQAGTFAIQTSTAQVGDPNKTITIHSGATLDFWQLNSTPLNKKVALADGAMVFNEKGPSIIAGPVTLSGNVTFDATNNGSPPSLTLANVVDGSGGLTVVGGGSLVLANANTYTGATIVSAATLTLTNSGSITGSTNISIGAGATLDASGRSDGTLTLADGQTLAGYGAVNGNTVIGSGATLAPSGSIGTLTFNYNLTLNNGSRTVMEINKSVSPSNNVVQVSGTVAYNGTLVITNIGSVPFAAGDQFQLFNAGGYNGAFAKISPAIPAVNLAWDTNNLGSGILKVISLPTPPPAFVSMVADVGGTVLSGTNGVPDWTYYVLASTNVSLPWTNWSIISTNTFDANGHFNFTNPAAPSLPQIFYLLQLH